MNKEAYNYCIFLLSKRDYSRYKIRQKLRSRKYLADEIEEVINELVSLNYLQEKQYERSRIKTLALKGFSDTYIKQKLAQEQLFPTEDEINQCNDDNNIDKGERLEYLISKKLRYKEIPTDYEEKFKLKNKVIKFLMSKGHRYSDIAEKLPDELK